MLLSDCHTYIPLSFHLATLKCLVGVIIFQYFCSPAELAAPRDPSGREHSTGQAGAGGAAEDESTNSHHPKGKSL